MRLFPLFLIGCLVHAAPAQAQKADPTTQLRSLLQKKYGNLKTQNKKPGSEIRHPWSTQFADAEPATGIAVGGKACGSAQTRQEGFLRCHARRQGEGKPVGEDGPAL